MKNKTLALCVMLAITPAAQAFFFTTKSVDEKAKAKLLANFPHYQKACKTGLAEYISVMILRTFGFVL